MPKVRMRIGHVAGISLTLLLAGTTLLEAQGVKPRLPRPGVPARGAADQPAPPAPPVNSNTTIALAPGVMLPCCVVEGVDQKGNLLLKDTGSGQIHSVKVGAPPAGTAGAVGSAATSAKYRPGQIVDMNIARTAMAVTAFPVKGYKRKEINGNSAWTMKTWVTVSDNGRIDGKTRLKSAEALRGFTGGVEVLLTDRVGNILHQTDLRKYGVNPNKTRTENWSETASPETLNKVRAVVVHQTYEPKVRLAAGLGWIKDNWDEVYTLYKCYLKYTEDDEKKGQAPAPPPPPPGQNQSTPPQQPGAMECVDAGQELADDTGM